jgi:hypothetical protein
VTRSSRSARPSARRSSTASSSATRRRPTPADPGQLAAHDDIPVPNPPPLPGDPLPPLVTPRGALRRSLLIWGWGQVVAGDRRGWLGPPVQIAALAALVAGAPTLVAGTNGELAFIAGAALLGAWALIAVHAHRRAARRRAALDLPPGDAGAAELLWFAPLVIALSSGFWIAAGDAGDPGVLLDLYVADWRAGRAVDAAGRFVSRPEPAALSEAWNRQGAALHNRLVAIAAAAGPNGGIDPDHPLDTVRWVDAGVTESGGRLVALEVARVETIEGQLFGILPTSSQRLVTLAHLGQIELRLVDRPGSAGGVVWRIARAEVLGVVVGS